MFIGNRDHSLGNFIFAAYLLRHQSLNEIAPANMARARAIFVHEQHRLSPF